GRFLSHILAPDDERPAERAGDRSAERLVGVRALAQLVVEVRHAGDRQFAGCRELAHQMDERHRVAAARQRDDDARGRGRETVPPDRTPDDIEQHEGGKGGMGWMGGKTLPASPALPARVSPIKSAGGRIRTVDPALMRRVLSPTELPRQGKLEFYQVISMA